MWTQNEVGAIYMKRIKCLSILLAAILLAGCAAVENRDAAPFQAGDSGAAASVAGSMVSTQTERGSRTLSEEEVLAAAARRDSAIWRRIRCRLRISTNGVRAKNL